MPRFTVRKLLIATAEVSVGLGAIALGFKLKHGHDPYWSIGHPGGLVGGGAMFIGSSVVMLFTKSWKLAIATGLIFAVIAMFFLLSQWIN